MSPDLTILSSANLLHLHTKSGMEAGGGTKMSLFWNK